MRLLTFLVLEILLSPVTLTGGCLLMLWSFTVSQQNSVSLTALLPLFCRWFLHLQGIRPDAAADSLVKNLPTLNPVLSWASVAPTLLAMNLSGYTPSNFNVLPSSKENIGSMMNTRTLFLDRALTRYLESVDQVVILGAGFDTRLLKFCLGKGLALFEVDQLATQRIKQRALCSSGLDTGEITFVPVDFNQENWIEKLTAAGFETGCRTFFLWEGVTYYLTEAVVVEALKAMAAVSEKGSAIAFDFFPQHFFEGRDFWWMPSVLPIFAGIGEPFKFGMDTTEGNELAVCKLLQDTGFVLDELQMVGAGSTQQESGFYGLAVVAKGTA
ncbi:MAG: SAM-dependent methyltransferase [Cyanobacteria bacterium J06649_4]